MPSILFCIPPPHHLTCRVWSRSWQTSKTTSRRPSLLSGRWAGESRVLWLKSKHLKKWATSVSMAAKTNLRFKSFSLCCVWGGGKETYLCCQKLYLSYKACKRHFEAYCLNLALHDKFTYLEIIREPDYFVSCKTGHFSHVQNSLHIHLANTMKGFILTC